MNSTLIATDNVRSANYMVRQLNRAGTDLFDAATISITDLARQIAIYALAQQDNGSCSQGQGPVGQAVWVREFLEKGIKSGDVTYFQQQSLDYATCREIAAKMDILRGSDLPKSFTQSTEPS